MVLGISGDLFSLFIVILCCFCVFLHAGLMSGSNSQHKAYPGPIPMIKYEGGDKYDLFGFDFEAEDERL